MIKKTGIVLPKMVIGTSSLGNLYKAISYSTKKDLVKTSLKCTPGIPVFDTAGKYGAGLAIEALGKALKELQASPEQVVISNKLGWRRTSLKGYEPTFEKEVWKDLKFDAIQDINYQGILKCFEEGNSLLGEFKTQLVSVHDPDEYLSIASSKKEYESRFDDILGAYQALAELRDSGKVKAIGIGAKDWELIQKIHQIVGLDWVMIANCMTIYSHPSKLLKFMEQLEQDKVAIINSAVFHSGFLVGGDHFDYRFASERDPRFRDQFQWRSKFFKLCRQMDVDPAHACVQFALNLPGVKSLALNSSSPDRIQINEKYCNSYIVEEFWEKMRAQNLIEDLKVSPDELKL